MGKYINNINNTPLGTSFISKCTVLIVNGATVITDIKFQKDLICVVDNGMFAAAGYIFDEREFEAFNQPDGRMKSWLILKDAHLYTD